MKLLILKKIVYIIFKNQTILFIIKLQKIVNYFFFLKSFFILFNISFMKIKVDAKIPKITDKIIDSVPGSR